MHRVAACAQPSLQQPYLGRFSRAVDSLDRDQPPWVWMGRAEQGMTAAARRVARTAARLGRVVACARFTVTWRFRSFDSRSDLLSHVHNSRSACPATASTVMANRSGKRLIRISLTSLE